MGRRARIFAVIVALALLPLSLHCGDASFDGGADASSDGTSPSDSSIPETSSIIDAAVDTGDSAVAVNPCVGDASHWICDNFDRAGNLTDFPYWTSTGITDGGATLVMEPPGGSAPPSPPNALVAMASPASQAVVFYSTSTSASGLSCDFDLRIDQDGSGYSSSIVLISLYTAEGYYRLNASLGPDGFEDYEGFLDGAVDIPPAQSFALPRHQWTHVRMQASLGDAGQVAIFVNGLTRNYTTTIDLTNLGQPTSASLELGPANEGVSGASWEMAFDNVYCDLIP